MQYIIPFVVAAIAALIGYFADKPYIAWLKHKYDRDYGSVYNKWQDAEEYIERLENDNNVLRQKINNNKIVPFPVSNNAELN